jgi:molybdopterin/thiamine biosynthesis adenylyltransferase/rhodanese-related sulfurtransferase
MPMLPELTAEELLRYGRHLTLPMVGLEGQQRLKAARVLCVGAGGLGSPVVMYLAAAGVGTLGLIDFDAVSLSNLQRQILYGTGDVGVSKLESARARLRALNPHVRVDTHEGPLTSHNALDIIRRYDIVVDGTDNFPTRYLVNDACVLLRKPNVFGAILRFDGQASVLCGEDGPCYRCVFPEPPEPGLVPSCAEAGVFGVLPGVIGTIQATEALKLILGAGTSLRGRLLVYDALQMSFQELRIHRDPTCPICGTTPTIRELIDYEAFCGTRAGAENAPAESTADFNIAPADLNARWNRGDWPFLLDVREPHEFQIVNLPDATLMPLSELTVRVRELDPSRELIVYCHHGVRSARAVAFLRSVGFARARNLRGGIDAWAVAVDGTMKRY